METLTPLAAEAGLNPLVPHPATLDGGLRSCRDVEQRMRRPVLAIVGVVLVVVGAVWTMQGLGYLPGSAMSGVTLWAIVGPVVAVIPFDGEDDAARLANATAYGLSGSVWTGDGAKALRMVRAVESGTLSVNSNSSVRYATPFGGFKQSGIGRDLGMQALDHYSETKTVFIAT